MTRTARWFSLGVVLVVFVLPAGCKKQEKTDKSISRIPPPAHEANREKPRRPEEKILAPPRRTSRVDRNDLTPLGYLHVVVRSRDRGKLAKSLGNLHSLGQAVQMYRAQEEAYPPSLQALVKAGLIGKSIVHSPGDRDYEIVYVPPASEQPEARDVLAFDPICYPTDRYAVLRIDGTAGEMSHDQLQTQLERQGEQ